ncbi:MAG: tRNA threonylcarbamoyladenosine dehydratase [Bacillota bacterium]|nr:tRNA threonylcarbamoyladenosine dehydratase [Bacillota bacterium]
MKKEHLARTEILIGRDALDKLGTCRVAVFGVGGVGGHVCEALVRSGIGAFDLIDKDCVSITNLNRQIIALRSTIGRSKVSVMKERMLDIDPEVDVRTYECFFTPENSHMFDFSQYDYVVDAVDTVSAKIELVMKAKQAGVPVICSMGAGNKLDPARFRIADIYETSVCPLARVMRREMRARNVDSLKVVYSDEPPIKTGAPETGSTAFVPAAAGLTIAGEIVKDLIRR